MRLIRATDPGENLSASESSDGLETLNSMLDAWNAERLTIPALSRKEFTLIPAQQQYEIGPGNPFDSPQVVKIEQGDAFLKNNTVEYPLQVVEQPKWAGIPLKDTQSIPRFLYYEMGAPFGLLNFFPIPDAAYTFVLYIRSLLSQIASAQEVMQFLPGYADAIAYNLALALAPEYDKQADALTLKGAVEGKARIKRQNLKPMILSCDPALASNTGGRGISVPGAFESGGID